MSTKTKKAPKLTKKQRGFVNDYVLEENGTKAALNNYSIESKNPESVAGVIANENLRKPYILEAIEVKRESLKEALEKKGITAEKIADKISLLLESEDNNAIDKGINHAVKVRGDYSEEKPKEKGTNIYNFFFNKELQEDVHVLEEKIKAKLVQKNV